jgi:hypothetical protein
MNIFKYSKTTIKDIELNNNSKSLFMMTIIILKLISNNTN